MNVVFDHSEDIARNIKSFWFKPERRVEYIAGQFTELYLPHDNPDDRGIRRWFTLSSSPTDQMVSITTKFATHQGSTFKRQLAALKPGTPLKLADPMGDFVLPKDPSIPLVFVAGGMGITPMHSMVKWLQDTGEQRHIHLMYAVTELADLCFEPLFRQYPMTFTPIIKNLPAGHPGETGSLSTDRILQLAGNDDRVLIYLSGPEPMIETFYKELKNKGISEERLVTDYFPGYARF
jgi:glycine betaine catabolism B